MYTKEDILAMLKNYSELKIVVRQLQFEVDHGAAHEALIKELAEAKLVIERLDFYISLLPSRQADVLRLIYFKGISWAETQKKMKTSSSALSRQKIKAINSLVKMFNRLL